MRLLVIILKHLHWAAKYGQVESEKALLDRSADVEAKNANALTPLHWAAALGHVDIVSLLVEKSACIKARSVVNNEPLHAAAAFVVIKTLLAKGADVEAKGGDEHRTPLHVSAENGHIEAVKVLLENSSDIEAEDGLNLTPLLLAAAKNQAEVVKVLLERSANMNANC